MQTVVSITIYVVVIMICYGVSYLLSADAIDIIAFVALAMGVDALTRVD